MKYAKNTKTGVVYAFGDDIDLKKISYLKEISLTKKQIDFLEKNPTEKYENILACKTAKEVLQDRIEAAKKEAEKNFDLGAYKLQILEQLNDVSIAKLDSLVSPISRENANFSLLALSANKDAKTIYTFLESMQILEKFNAIGSLCRDEYHRVEGLINSAKNKAEVDNVFASNRYENIVQ